MPPVLAAEQFMSQEIKVSGVIIAFNEEHNIKECIESLLPVVEEVLVVDSFSSDNTVSLSESLGARVIQHPFEGHIQQKNYAMEQAKYDYVLSLDADERVSEGMAKAVLAAKKNWKGSGYRFNRLNNYCGKWLRWSCYPDAKVRLWDRRKGKWGGANPHDMVEIPKEEITIEKSDILHYSFRNLEEHFQQAVKFAVISAKAKFEKKKKVSFIIHILLNPIFQFIRRYFFKLGFLDGYFGFMFTVVDCYYSLMKYMRLWEMNRKAKEVK